MLHLNELPDEGLDALESVLSSESTVASGKGEGADTLSSYISKSTDVESDIKLYKYYDVSGIEYTVDLITFKEDGFLVGSTTPLDEKPGSRVFEIFVPKGTPGIDLGGGYILDRGLTVVFGPTSKGDVPATILGAGDNSLTASMVLHPDIEFLPKPQKRDPGSPALKARIIGLNTQGKNVYGEPDCIYSKSQYQFCDVDGCVTHPRTCQLDADTEYFEHKCWGRPCPGSGGGSIAKEAIKRAVGISKAPAAGAGKINEKGFTKAEVREKKIADAERRLKVALGFIGAIAVIATAVTSAEKLGTGKSRREKDAIDLVVARKRAHEAGIPGYENYGKGSFTRPKPRTLRRPDIKLNP